MQDHLRGGRHRLALFRVARQQAVPLALRRREEGLRWTPATTRRRVEEVRSSVACLNIFFISFVCSILLFTPILLFAHLFPRAQQARQAHRRGARRWLPPVVRYTRLRVEGADEDGGGRGGEEVQIRGALLPSRLALRRRLQHALSSRSLRWRRQVRRLRSLPPTLPPSLSLSPSFFALTPSHSFSPSLFVISLSLSLSLPLPLPPSLPLHLPLSLARYDATGFIAKNADKLHDHLVAALASCGNPFARSLYESAQAASKRGAAGGAAGYAGVSLHPALGAISETGSSSASKLERRKRKKKGRAPTTAGTFSAQLKSLTSTLEATNLHFVRCIKSNDDKATYDSGIGACSGPGVMRQLLFSGVLETIKIRRQGYPTRAEFAPLWESFSRRNWHYLAGISPHAAQVRSSQNLLLPLFFFHFFFCSSSFIYLPAAHFFCLPISSRAAPRPPRQSISPRDGCAAVLGAALHSGDFAIGPFFISFVCFPSSFVCSFIPSSFDSLLLFAIA